jgi:HNH endonuclease
VKPKKVFVRISDSEEPESGYTITRIYNNLKEAVLDGCEDPKQFLKKDAVFAIRHLVYNRSKGLCEYCGATLTWNTSEMHEKVPKGKGGEVSISNCVMLCHACHQGRNNSEHGNRKWQSPNRWI